MTYEWLIREANGKDLPFIYSSWLSTYRYDSVLGKSCRNNVFFPEYTRVIDGILYNSKAVVACHKETPDVLFSYLVYEGTHLHYALTKKLFVKLGLFRSLLSAAGPFKIFTHRTVTFQHVIEDKHPEWNYNPFLIYKR